jgi:predicted cupin superfamily sugar epimerase
MKGIPAAAQSIIDHFEMIKIPHEGPWFAPTFKSTEVLEGPAVARYGGDRFLYSAILAVFTREDFSAMHSLLTDEMWHFYGGSPMELLLLYPDGSGEIKRLGNDVTQGHSPQLLVPAGTWMGASPVGTGGSAYTFGGNSLAPAFEYADYVPGIRSELIEAYPAFARRITELTRQGGG